MRSMPAREKVGFLFVLAAPPMPRRWTATASTSLSTSAARRSVFLRGLGMRSSISIFRGSRDSRQGRKPTVHQAHLLYLTGTCRIGPDGCEGRGALVNQRVARPDRDWVELFRNRGSPSYGRVGKNNRYDLSIVAVVLLLPVRQPAPDGDLYIHVSGFDAHAPMPVAGIAVLLLLPVPVVPAVVGATICVFVASVAGVPLPAVIALGSPIA